MVWYSQLFKNFLQFVVVHTVKGFGIVNKAIVSLELSSFFDDPTDVGNLISGSSAFSKSSLNMCKFSVHIFLNTAAAAAKSLQSCPTLCDPIDRGPLSLGFSRQEHWSGFPFPSPVHESEK